MKALTKEKYLKIQSSQESLDVEEFCKLWIPKLYGLKPQEYGYRKACVTELKRLMGDAITVKGIEKNWKWQNGQTNYPTYVKPLLSLASERYRIMEQLDMLPIYNSAVFVAE